MPAPRDPPLTVDEIVAAATRLTRQHGLAAVSMRALSDQLTVSPMALYHHVGDRAALCDRVADGVVASVAVPSARCGWQTWLRRYHAALWDQLRRHPGVGELLLVNPTTTAGAAIRRATVDMFLRNGFSEREALLATSTFHTHLLGRLSIDVRPDRTQAAEPYWSSQGLHRRDYVDHGLDTVLAGLAALHVSAG